MPLFDHFHPLMKDDLPWETLHSAWATYLATALSQTLVVARLHRPGTHSCRSRCRNRCRHLRASRTP